MTIISDEYIIIFGQFCLTRPNQSPAYLWCTHWLRTVMAFEDTLCFYLIAILSSLTMAWGIAVFYFFRLIILLTTENFCHLQALPSSQYQWMLKVKRCHILSCKRHLIHLNCISQSLSLKVRSNVQMSSRNVGLEQKSDAFFAFQLGLNKELVVECNGK